MAEQTVSVQQDIRSQQRAAAARFRRTLAAQGTLVVRLLSSPGAGKTTLLQQTAQRLGTQYQVGVLVGDVETQRNAQRLAPYAPSVQITTGGACHLELPLIERALPELGVEKLDFLFLEDIGNLICPASHELGEHLRVILLSTTEGDDKPGKYPKAFRTSQVTLISKLDLLPYVPFSLERAEDDVRQVQPEMKILRLCALTGEGMDAWCELLIERRDALLSRQLLLMRGSGPEQPCRRKLKPVAAPPPAPSMRGHHPMPAADHLRETHPRAARQILLQGQVQGLGVRPVLFRLATSLGLGGRVQNTARGVEIHLEGSETALAEFLQRLPQQLPAASCLKQMEVVPCAPQGEQTFTIQHEPCDGPLGAGVPPDYAVCPACLAEVRDRSNRRSRYPFTSCTLCGPRYTIIASMPYERADTSMTEFPFCDPCRREYQRPGERRFHAQTNACGECGPHVWSVDAHGRACGRDDAGLQAAVGALRAGQIVALRGVGGYQLLVDATDPRGAAPAATQRTTSQAAGGARQFAADRAAAGAALRRGAVRAGVCGQSHRHLPGASRQWPGR